MIQTHSPIIIIIIFRYGFSLEETDARDAAEKVCIDSIAIQPKNPWGIHTMSKRNNMVVTV